MKAKEIIEEFENRVNNGELEKDVSGGVEVLTYYNYAENIVNGRCRRKIIHYKRLDEIICIAEHTIGFLPEFESWDVWEKEGKRLVVSEFTRINN